VGDAPASEAAWQVVAPGYTWSFPQDHRSNRDYKTEWWYFVGHLHDPGGVARFGYQLTFFRLGLLPEAPSLDSAWAASDLVMVHAAVTDLKTGEHRFREVVYRACDLLGGFPAHPDPVLAWSRGPAGTAEPWTLKWNGRGFDLNMRADRAGFALRLTTAPERPLVFQGPGGFSRKGQGPTAASLYYSFTRLATEGVVELDGVEHRVQGSSWLDRERSTYLLDDGQVGWDWFGLQLEDGHDLMMFRLRNAGGGTDHVAATLVTPSGDVHYLEPGQWSLEETGNWTSPESQVTYPSGWRLSIPTHTLELTVTPRAEDQENRGRILYWEGSVLVQDAGGSPVGQGYAELTGYGSGNRPAL
jgi:predicted secreted hydrolase